MPDAPDEVHDLGHHAAYFPLPHRNDARCCCRVFYFFKSRGKKEDLVSQPTGTGFSYTSDDRDTCHDETGVSNDLQDFLQVLFFCQFFVADVLSFFYCIKFIWCVITP